MFRVLRSAHRWVGLTASVFLLILSVTGFLLAIKSRVAWMRPPMTDAQRVSSSAEIVSMERVMTSVLARGIPEIRSLADVDRIDYRPKDNVFKVLSKTGYQEVQVDGSTGEVLSVAVRNDQITEDIHDLSIVSKVAHEYALPLIAVALGALAISGISISLVPVLRRRKYRSRAVSSAASKKIATEDHLDR
ncbi:MAG: PepSY-associated TM helix domain-containing protein [Fimbriimonadaceae bacterium]|nr:PepSY-associated TM helix domain-containing protein [Fimbriimonadaceae bacterium]